jgi:4-hydroxybenzoate polyprenyltransferase
MIALQAAIGALNDVVDAPRDAGHKPGKPIPAGLVARETGIATAAVAALAGLGLSVPSGPPTIALAIAILAVGGLYDLRLKGTALSWLPFAIGIPLLPIFGWLGATGDLPPAFAVLLPAAFLAGAGLALANALVDVERDRAAGADSTAVHLGMRRAWRLHLAAHAVVVGLAAVSLLAWQRPPVLVAAAVGLPALVVLVGAWLSAAASSGLRERGWELESIGIAVLGGTWAVLALLH